jgi:hypothetical protein
VYLAFCWGDMPDDQRQGWYTVAPGKFEAFTLKNAVYNLTAQDFGYYATGGGKVWAGKASDTRTLSVIINPHKPFAGRRNDPIAGGQKVYFKRLTLKESDSSGENAYGSFVLWW